MKKKGNLFALPAAQGDCLLFQFENDEGMFKHVLIDGGNRTSLDFINLKRTILQILSEGGDGNIDLLIVTHSDDDHISGILKMLADNELNEKIKKIWFNSEKNISDHFKTVFANTQKYEIKEVVKGISKSSRNQDYDLYKLLENDSRWDKELIYSGREEIIDNLKIKVLSPTIDKLKILNEYWPKMKLTSKRQTEKSSSRKSFDYDLTYKDFLMNIPTFKEDSAAVNGGSIGLLLEWRDNSFLLLSDAHPSVIVEKLSDLGRGEKVKIDAIKVSHHGSCKNTSDELLDLIECENFIISANANRTHYHPDKEALCRILMNNGVENTKFFFTYHNKELERIFQKEPDVNVIFPTDRERGVCLVYEY